MAEKVRQSLPVRGAWIEMCFGGVNVYQSKSLPVRGAWIEILYALFHHRRFGSLPVRGAWIEISIDPVMPSIMLCRSPCGERGLKSTIHGVSDKQVESLPVRGAWIEMTIYTRRAGLHESLPVRGAWIEIYLLCNMFL